MKTPTQFAVTALTVLLLAGCGNSGSSVAPNTVPGSEEDRAAVMAEAARQGEFVEDGVFESTEPMSTRFSAVRGTGATIEAAITPVTFWRRFRTTDRSFNFVFSDPDTSGQPTRAILEIHKELTGTFNIQVEDTTGGFNRTVIRKPLEDQWVRRLLFERVPGRGNGKGGDDDDDDGDDDDDHGDDIRAADPLNGGGKGHGGGKRGKWRLIGVTGVEVESEGHATDIVSLRIEGGGVDTTIVDPLPFRMLGSVLELEPQSEVTITVTTAAPDDVVLLISRERRVRLQGNGDNTYSGTFTVPTSLGCRHFGVNALSNGTLFDDEAPYDSEAWLLPSFNKGRGFNAARLP